MVMQYRYLGQTGLQVSCMTLGNMLFGTQVDNKEASAIYSLARDAGINSIDTSSTYGNGRAEETLSPLIKGHRDEIILSSKVFFPTSTNVNDRGLSKRHIVKTVNQSLKKLGTDYIDIYYLHCFDSNTSLVDSLEVLDHLVRSGKILYIGLSNFSSWQVMKAISICQQHNFVKPVCIQPVYNLLKRQAEVEIFPMAESESLGVMTYSPLAGGLLTGKYHNNTAEGDARLNVNPRYKARYWKEKYINISEKLINFASFHQVSPIGLALSWILLHDVVTSIILGPKRRAQLTECLLQTDCDFIGVQRQNILDLLPSLATATDR